MIKVHKQVWYIVAFFLGFFLYDVAFASAQIVDENNNLSFQYDHFYSVYFSDSDIDTINGNTGFRYSDALPAYMYPDPTAWILNRTGANPFLIVETTGSHCNGRSYQACITNALPNPNSATFVSVENYPYQAPPPPASNISFVDTNDFSTDDMLASVRAGTQETTKDTLPLMVFVGIPLAFVILGGVSYLISNSVKEEKKQKSGFNRRAFNRKANELENFYSKKGASGAPYDIK